MHDIDRTLLEYDPESAVYEQEDGEYANLEWTGESGEVFDESDVMELASSLLEVTSDEELDYFLGDLIKKASRAVGKVVRSPVGKALGGVLKGAARKALPIVGGAIGGYLGGSSGARIGSKLASGAGKVFGLEVEGLSHEDQAFEVAKQYVRFAADAVKNAAVAPGANPAAVAKSAVTRAAARHAPGLVRVPPRQAAAAARSVLAGSRGGRWVRRGNRIVLYGV